MACRLTITLNNGEKLVFDDFIELSNTPIRDVAKALFNDTEKRNQVIDSFTRFYGTNKEITNSQIGNVSYKTLTEQVPIRGGWPEFDLEEAGTNILYIDQFGASEYCGPAVTMKVGEKQTITVQPLYRNQLNSFRNKILSRKLISELNEDTKFSDKFNALTERMTLEEKKTLLDDFLSKGTVPRETIKYNDEILEVSGILSSEIAKLAGLIDSRVYKVEFFNYLKKALNENNRGNYEIQVGNFMDKALHLLKDDKNFKEELRVFKQVMDDELEGEDVESKINTAISSLMNKLREKDAEFPYYFKTFRNGTVVEFNLISKTISEIYPEVTYEQARRTYVFQQEYKGYDIYQNNGRYYYTKGPIIPDKTKLIPLNSLEDTIRSIDYKIKNSKGTIAFYLNKALKSDNDRLYKVTEMSFEAGDVIKSLNYTIKPGKVLEGSISKIVNDSKFYDFVNYIKSVYNNPTYNSIKEYILENIDTPEKAGVFLYEISGDKYNISKVYDIVTNIKNAGYKYFFVLHAEKTKKHLRVVQINEDSFKSLKVGKSETKLQRWNNQDIPKARFINALAEMIQEKVKNIGYVVQQRTAEEIAKEYPKADSKAKAFLTTQKIGDKVQSVLVINTTVADITTPLHEYAHIFLAMLKARDIQRYRNLVQYGLNQYKNQKTLVSLREQKKEAYKGMSEYDIDEELFADIFSRHLLDNTELAKVVTDVANGEKINIKQEVENSVLEALNTLNEFSSKGFNLYNLWDQPISIFAKYNSSVIADLDDETEKHKVFRQASNWIRDQISKQNIREKCQLI